MNICGLLVYTIKQQARRLITFFDFKHVGDNWYILKNPQYKGEQ